MSRCGCKLPSEGSAGQRLPREIWVVLGAHSLGSSGILSGGLAESCYGHGSDKILKGLAKVTGFGNGP